MEAIAHDHSREIPMVESLLGSILGVKGELGPAIDHLRKYLDLSPQATDADVIEKKIAELERCGMELKQLGRREPPELCARLLRVTDSRRRLLRMGQGTRQIIYWRRRSFEPLCFGPQPVLQTHPGLKTHA